MLEESPLLETDTVQRVLSAGLARGADFAEVFVEEKRSSSALLDDGRVEELTSGRDRGAGIRVVVGESTGFAHTSDLSEAGLIAAAETAAAAARGNGSGSTVVALEPTSAPRPNDVLIPPSEVAKATKVELLVRADDVARQVGSAITQVSARYADSRRRILVANSDGVFAGDDQVRTLFSISCVGIRRHRHADGARVGRSHRRLRAVRRLRRRRAGSHGRRSGAHQAGRATGALR